MLSSSFKSAPSDLNASLHESEKRTLQEFETAIAQANDETLSDSVRAEQLQFAITNIVKWSPEAVLRFSAKSGNLNRFLETNETLQQHWLKRVKEKNQANTSEFGIPITQIKTANGKEILSVYDLYRADCYFVLYKNAMEQKSNDMKERTDFLEKAIRLGSFAVMALYSKFKISQVCQSVFSPATSPKKPLPDNAKNKLKTPPRTEQVMQDIIIGHLLRLGRLYGAVGYMFAANELMKFVDIYINNPTKEKFARIVFHEAAKMLVCAAKLEKDEKTISLQETVLKGHSLFSLLTAQSLKDLKSFNAITQYLKDSDRYSDISMNYDAIEDRADLELYEHHEKRESAALTQ